MKRVDYAHKSESKLFKEADMNDDKRAWDGPAPLVKLCSKTGDRSKHGIKLSETFMSDLQQMFFLG